MGKEIRLTKQLELDFENHRELINCMSAFGLPPFKGVFLTNVPLFDLHAKLICWLLRAIRSSGATFSLSINGDSNPLRLVEKSLRVKGVKFNEDWALIDLLWEAVKYEDVYLEHCDVVSHLTQEMKKQEDIKMKKLIIFDADLTREQSGNLVENLLRPSGLAYTLDMVEIPNLPGDALEVL